MRRPQRVQEMIGLVILTVALALLAAPLAAEAQPTAKAPRVGILGFGRVPSPEEMAKSPFIQAMREVGWVEGQNMVIERRYGESSDQLHAAAAELVRLKVDVLVVSGAAQARTAQAETKTIPIVILGAGIDLVAEGLVASLARPGGNVTGSQLLQADLAGKRLQLLKELVPNLSRVATLGSSPGLADLKPSTRASVAGEAAVAARTLGLDFHRFAVSQPEDFPVVFRGMIEKGVRGLLVTTTPFLFTHRNQIVDLAALHRIAVIYETKPFVEAGGLMSYGQAPRDAARVAATYVDKILNGAKPADLPVEQPTKFELVINLKTAKGLGVTIPQSVLVRADKVIQ